MTSPQKSQIYENHVKAMEWKRLSVEEIPGRVILIRKETAWIEPTNKRKIRVKNHLDYETKISTGEENSWRRGRMVCMRIYSPHKRIFC